MPHKPGVGAIFGITAEDGVAAMKRVVLIDRSNLKVVATTTADENGAYVFNGLNPETDDYLAFSVDDDGAPPKNALIQDYITPIPAYQGATFPGNYYLLSRRHDPIFSWYGFNHGGEDLSNVGLVHSSINVKTQGGVIRDLPTYTPAAPQIPHLELDGGILVIQPRAGGTDGGNDVQLLRRYRGFPFTQDFTNTIEIVADLSTPFDVRFQVQPTNTSRTQSFTSDNRSVAMIYRTNENTLLFRAANGSSSNSTSSGVDTVGSFNVTGVSKEPHHFVFVMEFGFQVSLYVDGVFHSGISMAAFAVPFGTTSGAGSQNNTTVGYGWCYVGAVNGTSNSTLQAGVGVRVAVINLYGKKLEPAEIQGLYNALMTPSTPNVTGYDKEVVIDSPTYYFPLNAVADDAGAEFMSLRPNIANGTVFYGDVSPVVGKTALRFAGDGVMANRRVGGIVGTMAMSIEFFVMPQGADAFQIIYKSWHADTTNSNTAQQLSYNYRVNRTADGSLQVQFIVSGAVQTLSFTTPLTVDNWHHVVMTFDKTLASNNARLYLNGVLAETLTINQVPFEHHSSSVNTVSSAIYNAYSTSLSEFSVTNFGGSRRNNNGVIESGFVGRLSCFAMYPKALSAARALAHYEARNSV